MQTNITNGIAWLKSKQKPSGAFGEGSAGTAYETALVYLALAAELGTADVAAGNALGYLVSAQLISGSWESDPFATGLALQALNVPSTPLIKMAFLMGSKP